MISNNSIRFPEEIAVVEVNIHGLQYEQPHAVVVRQIGDCLEIRIMYFKARQGGELGEVEFVDKIRRLISVEEIGSGVEYTPGDPHPGHTEARRSQNAEEGSVIFIHLVQSLYLEVQDASEIERARGGIEPVLQIRRTNEMQRFELGADPPGTGDEAVEKTAIDSECLQIGATLVKQGCKIFPVQASHAGELDLVHRSPPDEILDQMRSLQQPCMIHLCHIEGDLEFPHERKL
jgi:hypothetical protein